MAMAGLSANKLIIFNGLAYKSGLVFLFGLLLASPAWTAQPDPFAVTIGSDWVTVDAYAKNHKASAPNDAQQSGSDVSVPAIDAAPASASGGQKEGQRIATPTRALNFPVMPGLASHAPVTVTTTADDAMITDQDQQRSWKNIQEAQAAAEQDEQAQQVLAEQSEKGLHIRLPALPSSEIQSIPATRVSYGKLASEAKAAALEAKAKRTTPASLKQAQVTTEACEAMATYRRRQLQALESDRKTLAQLKKVLSELGLTSKLDFMTEAEDSLLVSPQKGSSSGTPSKVP